MSFTFTWSFPVSFFFSDTDVVVLSGSVPSVLPFTASFATVIPPTLFPAFGISPCSRAQPAFFGCRPIPQVRLELGAVLVEGDCVSECFDRRIGRGEGESAGGMIPTEATGVPVKIKSMHSMTRQ